LNHVLGKSSVMVSRSSAWLIAAVAACVVLAPSSRAQAQWWSGKPADFEDCAERAEKAAKDERAARLSECHSKFAGRRKPGGGYTYFDFMQNRHFDIAGPNPTAEEQKQIDEQYIAYLDQERRSTIAAAFAAKQQQQAQQQQQVEQRAASRARPKGAGAAGKPCEATGRRQRSASARQGRPMRQFILLRMAAALRRINESRNCSARRRRMSRKAITAAEYPLSQLRLVERSIGDHHRPKLPVRRFALSRRQLARTRWRAPAISRFSRWPVEFSHCFSISENVKNPAPIFSAARDLRNGATRVAKLPAALWLTEPLAAIACACCSATALSRLSSFTAGSLCVLR
jgi:hypothetical protein